MSQVVLSLCTYSQDIAAGSELGADARHCAIEFRT